MKTVTAEHQALLDTGVFLQADLYTITLINGTVLRYTSFDRDLTWGGYTWRSVGANITRTSLSWKSDLSVDAMDLDIIVPGMTEVLGVPFFAAVKNGVFDGATVRMDRAHMRVYKVITMTVPRDALRAGFADGSAFLDPGQHIDCPPGSMVTLIDKSGKRAVGYKSASGTGASVFRRDGTYRHDGAKTHSL